MSRKIILASNNAGKLREIAALLEGHGVEFLPQSAFAIPDADETGLTFVENALIKARHACRRSGLPALADDSGLEVDALGGAPGVYSARYAGPGAGDAANNAKLLAALAGVPEAERSARFRCVLAYLRHEADPSPLIAQGVWEGRILSAERGTGGFGYDPLFFLPASRCTSAELPADEKNRLSHRGQALRELVRQWID
jgi:XTP/dITP diphosphohydrolase